MLLIRNRLKYWRHQLLIDTQTQFAEFLGVTRQQLNVWERHEGEPSLETAYKLWIKLKEKIPDMNLQDLFEKDLD